MSTIWSGIHSCAFMVPAVEYLGHRISAQGLQEDPGNSQCSSSNQCQTTKILSWLIELLL